MRYLTILLGILVLGGQSPSPGPAQSLPLEKIKLPPGFAIDVYATGVENARQMALGDNGTLFVGSQQAGRVHAVVDRGQDNKADQVYTIAQGLSMPYAQAGAIGWTPGRHIGQHGTFVALETQAGGK